MKRFLALLFAVAFVVVGMGSPIAATRPIAYVPTGSGFIKVSSGTEQSAASSIALASDVTGTLGVDHGGTGVASLPSGEILLGNGTSAVSSVATLGVTKGGTGAATLASGEVLLGNGTGAITSTATLGVSKGGTGATTLASGEILLGNGTSAITSTATLGVSKGGTGAGTLPSGEILLGNGTSAITSTATLGVSKGGTGATSFTANNVLLGNGTSALQTVAPGSTGNVLMSNGTTWTSAAAPGGWQTIADIDFSAQGSQTLSSNGDYTIAGYTFTKANSAKDSTALALTNGSGIVIVPLGSSITGSTRTCPLIRTLLSGLSPPSGFSKASGVRISAYLSAYSQSINNAGDNFYVGLDAGSNAWTQYFVAKFPGSSTSYTPNDHWTVNNTTSEVAASSATYSSNKVMVLEIPALIGAGVVAGNLLTGSNASSSWPAETALSPLYAHSFGSTDTGITNFPTNHLTGLGVTLAGCASNDSFHPSFTVAKLKVEVRQ